MNFIPGVVKRANGAAQVETPTDTRLPLPGSIAAQSDHKVGFVSRPEHLSLGKSGESVEAQVQVVEPTGAEPQVFAELAGTQITAVFTERHDFQPGDQIMLRPRPETIHLFDAESGRHL